MLKERERVCKEHGATLMWATCWNCDEGLTGHDCGEDCCCCAEPEADVICDVCHGNGGFMVCPVCSPDAEFA